MARGEKGPAPGHGQGFRLAYPEPREDDRGDHEEGDEDRVPVSQEEEALPQRRGDRGDQDEGPPWRTT